MEAQEQLAARHIALRERAGLTQEQEAKMAGVSPTTISGIESGKITRPHLKTLLKLARALGADVGELRESGKVEAPPSPEQPPLNGFEEERRAQWDAAIRNARRLREHGRTRMEALLSLWRESKERGEAKDARRDYLDEMGGLLDDALDARSALQKNASVPALDGIPLGKIPIPEFEEIAEADSFYWSLRNMVRGAGYLSIRPKRRPDREVHEVEEAA